MTTTKELIEAKVKCFICDSTHNVARSVPIMTGDVSDRYPVCKKCVCLWHGTNITDVDELRACRKMLDMNEATK